MRSKKILPFCTLSLSFLLLSCQTPEKVDLQAEMQNRPEILLSWEGQSSAPNITGGFCSDVLCVDTGEPDWSALKFTPYQTDLPLNLEINSTLPISELLVSLKNTQGDTIQNNLDIEEITPGNYTITEAFKHNGELILSAKVRFVEGGYGQTYFPLDVE